jgi:DUF2075 family protein/SOS-response transcriptional repressor LexA
MDSQSKKTLFQTIILIIFGFAAIVAIGIFAANKGSVSKKDPSQATGTVRIWGTLPSEPMKNMFSILEQNNKDLRIVYEQKPLNTFENDLVHALASGIGPDIFMVTPETVLSNRSRLTAIPYSSLSSTDFKNSFVNQANLFLFPEGIIALPMFLDPLVLYINQDILTQSFVVNEPKTWEDIISLNSSLTKLTDSGQINQAMIGMGAFDNVNRNLGFDINDGTQLHWIMKKSKYQIFFYDKEQSVYPSDIGHEIFSKVVNNFTSYELSTQLRVEGGDKYIKNIKNLFNNDNFNLKNIKKYDFQIFDNIQEMVNLIKTKDREFGICRMLAGYAWEWISKNDRSKFDIKIQNTNLRWNTTTDNWIYSKDAINEVGCIHTVQGYDLNYAGVIIGPELSYDFENKKFIFNKTLYKDRNGKKSVQSDQELLEFVLNIYKVLLTRAIKGTYIYICDENLKKYINGEIDKEVKKIDIIKNIVNKNIISPYTSKGFITRNIELFDSVGCGDTRNADSASVETLLVRDNIMYKGRKYFALRTSGDSMNKKGINDGDLVLCMKDYHPVDGNIVVALMGEDAILKEYRTKGGNVTLKPNSTNPMHKDITITPYDEEVKIQGVFVKVLKAGEDYMEN